MKDIKTLVREMKGHSDTSKEKMIREYCHQVIDLCAGNFECSMEDSDELEDMMDERGEMVPKQYPVLMRGSVLRVKQLI